MHSTKFLLFFEILGCAHLVRRTISQSFWKQRGYQYGSIQK